MLQRVGSALILVPATLALLFYAPRLLFLSVIGLLGSICLYEFRGLADRMGFRVPLLLALLLYWGILVGSELHFLPPHMMLAGALMLAFLAAFLSPGAIRDRISGLMATYLSVLYCTLCLNALIPLRFDFGERLGLYWILIVLAVIWAGDSAALFVGKAFGRTPFAPAISPKKTNEGAIGGLVAGVLAAIALQQLVLRDLPLTHVAVLSVILGIVGQLGDLAESMLKRAADVKDSSNLIPGHGGLLDRIDSLLFAFPVTYIYLLRLYSH